MRLVVSKILLHRLYTQKAWYPRCLAMLLGHESFFSLSDLLLSDSCHQVTIKLKSTFWIVWTYSHRQNFDYASKLALEFMFSEAKKQFFWLIQRALNHVFSPLKLVSHLLDKTLQAELPKFIAYLLHVSTSYCLAQQPCQMQNYYWHHQTEILFPLHL